MSLWCRHRNQTTPRRDKQGEYRRCLECGARIAWAWHDELPIGLARRGQPLGEHYSAGVFTLNNRKGPSGAVAGRFQR